MGNAVTQCATGGGEFSVDAPLNIMKSREQKTIEAHQRSVGLLKQITGASEQLEKQIQRKENEVMKLTLEAKAAKNSKNVKLATRKLRKRQVYESHIKRLDRVSCVLDNFTMKMNEIQIVADVIKVSNDVTKWAGELGPLSEVDPSKLNETEDKLEKIGDVLMQANDYLTDIGSILKDDPMESGEEDDEWLQKELRMLDDVDETEISPAIQPTYTTLNITEGFPKVPSAPQEKEEEHNEPLPKNHSYFRQEEEVKEL